MQTVSSSTARRLALSALAAAAAAALAGCGGEREVSVAGTVLRLRLDEFRITPQLVRVHPGRLKIVAYNTGVLTHNLKVELNHPDAYGQPIVVGGTPTALPGEEVETKITLPAGTYAMVDTLANHRDLGQYATLVVR